MFVENNIKCTACELCVKICPTQAIVMETDNEGFAYPKIDSAKCIKCGACNIKCPTMRVDEQVNNRIAYYGWTKNEEFRKNSTSGGVFSALATYVLKRGGVVYGAFYDSEQKRVYHTSTKEVGLDKLLKSKYVESDVSGIISNIENDIKGRRLVLFCGTPCQCAGIRKYFGNNENLIIVDFLCHGVPSAKLLKEHLIYLERKYKVNINNLYFRKKVKGWSKRYLLLETNKGEITIPCMVDEFYKGFYVNICLRKSCYSCQFINNRYADITIADFWRYKNIDPQLNDEKGLSLFITHNCVGENIIKSLDELYYKEINYNDYVKMEFEKSTMEGYLPAREKFYSLLGEYSFEKAAKKTYFHKPIEYFKYFIKKILKKA